MNKIVKYNRLIPIVILICCSLNRSKAAELFEDTIEKTYEVESGGTLTIDSNLGDIDVKGVGGNQVHIKIIRKIKAKNQRAANQIFENLDIDIHQQSKDVIITAEFYQPKNDLLKWIDGSHRWPNIQFIVTVPQVYHLDLQTEDGNVLVDNIKGLADIKTSDGNVQIGSVKGPVAIKTSDGNIFLDQCSESADLKTSDGNIKVNWIKSDVSARTSDGSISIQKAEGSITAKTSDGGIEVEEFGSKIEAMTSDGSITAKMKNQPQEGCRLKTSDGSIRLYISEDIKITIDAKSHDGRIKTDFPMEITGELDDNKLYGKINGGGPEVYLLTSDGSIHLIKL